jgi:antibiotic biosynthesis monooxygenase (ABM) superfamily enzyme
MGDPAGPLLEVLLPARTHLPGENRCARRFPGNEGVARLRPEGGHRDERASWHARIEDIATEIGSERQSTTGMETWFSLPGTTVQSPPRWKMVLTTFLGA